MRVKARLKVGTLTGPNIEGELEIEKNKGRRRSVRVRSYRRKRKGYRSGD